MTFLAPLLLLGLAAVAAPVLLHLLRRRERKTFVFPALRYLKRTTREHARIIRLRQLLLLALRISAVVVAVLAGARLVLPLGGNDDPPAAVVLIIDNGLSSGAVVGEDRVLDSLTVRAGEVLDRTGPRDQIWVVPAGAPWDAVVPLAPDGARARVGGLDPTHVTADLPAALGRAESLLSATDSEVREIVLLSDLRPGSVSTAERVPNPDGPNIRVAPPPTTPSLNHGISEIQIAGGVTPRAGDLAQIQVRVVGVEAEGATVRAYVDGDLIGSSTVQPGGTTSLPLPRLEEGWVEGRVELEPDDLRGDDVAHFAFQAISPPTVEITGSPPPFLEEALSVLVDAGRIERAEGPAAEVQIVAAPFASRPRPDAGVIVVPPADPALLPALNRGLAELLPGWRLDATDSAPGERRVRGGTLSEILPTAPGVRTAYSIEPPERAERITNLLTLADGTPWLVETESPEGRPVILFASPLTAEASGLPTSAAMLPLVEVLTGRLSDGEPTRSIFAGSPAPIPDGATSVRSPGGTLHTLEGTSGFAETGSTGIYTFLGPESDTISLLAVNPRAVPPGPSLEASEAASRLTSGWPSLEVADPWPSSVLRERRGREVGRMLLFVLFVILVAESWMAAAADRGSQSTRSNPASTLQPMDSPGDPATNR